jgi:hypothetical protein
MMEDIKHISQLASPEMQSSLLSLVEDAGNFPWYYVPSIVRNREDSFGFTHSVYKEGVPNSNYFDFFIPLLEQFEKRTNTEIKEILRARIRMTVPVLGKSFSNLPHTDFDVSHKAFVYYINDSDGDTIFYDKFRGEDISDLKEVARVSPKMGDAVMFEGLRFHSGAVPSKNRRIVLNVDYL